MNRHPHPHPDTSTTPAGTAGALAADVVGLAVATVVAATALARIAGRKLDSARGTSGRPHDT